LSFGTGRLPSELWPLCFYPGVLTWCAVGLLLGLVRRVSASRLPTERQSRALLVAAPILLFGLRGPGPFSALPAIAGWVGTAVLIWMTVRLICWAPRVTGNRVLLVTAATQLLAGVGLTLRWGGLAVLHGQGARPLLSALGIALLATALVYMLPSLVRLRLHGRPVAGVLAAAGVLNLAAFGTARVCGSAPPAFPPPRGEVTGGTRRNLVLVVLDTVRRDHLSLYGYGRSTTPHLDHFAQEATTFAAAYATSPYTLASHASLFTGELPGKHGARQIPWDIELQPPTAPRDYPLAAHKETLAERLRSRGYRTMAVVANVVYLRPWTGLDQGFEYYDCRPGPKYGYPPTILPLSVRFLPELYNDIRLRELRSARDITGEALRVISTSRKGRPFFLFVNYMDAHWPYRSPARLRRRFVPDEAWLRWSRVASWATPDDHVHEAEAGQRDAVVAHYDAAIAFMDEQLGELLGALEDAGLRGNTVVVVTSDHGEAFGEHGLVMHDNSLYEEELRIPLVIRPAGRSRKRTVDESVNLADVHALILQALEDRPLEAHERAGPVVRSQMWARIQTVGPPFQQASYLGGWKLISGDAPLELYDLSTDPAEKHNRLTDASLPAPARELRDARWGRPPDPQTSDVVLSPEDRARLRSLGYVY
jgi:arylsulfatase A-like enzyme